MNRRVKQHIILLRFILFADRTQQKSIVKCMTNEQFDTLSEIALNIYTGTYPLSKAYIKMLQPYKAFIRKLGSREISTSKKRRILLKHLELLPLLLKPIVQYYNRKWQRN